jgi:hypothetical protein
MLLVLPIFKYRDFQIHASEIKKWDSQLEVTQPENGVVLSI